MVVTHRKCTWSSESSSVFCRKFDVICGSIFSGRSKMMQFMTVWRTCKKVHTLPSRSLGPIKMRRVWWEPTRNVLHFLWQIIQLFILPSIKRESTTQYLHFYICLYRHTHIRPYLFEIYINTYHFNKIFDILCTGNSTRVKSSIPDIIAKTITARKSAPDPISVKFVGSLRIANIKTTIMGANM